MILAGSEFMIVLDLDGSECQADITRTDAYATAVTKPRGQSRKNKSSTIHGECDEAVFLIIGFDGRVQADSGVAALGQGQIGVALHCRKRSGRRRPGHFP